MNVEDLQLHDLIVEDMSIARLSQTGRRRKEASDTTDRVEVYWIVTRLPTATEADINEQYQLLQTMNHRVKGNTHASHAGDIEAITPSDFARLFSIEMMRCYHFLCFEGSRYYQDYWEMRDDSDCSLAGYFEPIKVYRAGQLIFDSEMSDAF